MSGNIWTCWKQKCNVHNVFRLHVWIVQKLITAPITLTCAVQINTISHHPFPPIQPPSHLQEINKYHILVLKFIITQVLGDR